MNKIYDEILMLNSNSLKVFLLFKRLLLSFQARV